MSSKSKQKGNRFERECVEVAKDKDVKAIRAWGSDGRSLGLTSEVDILIDKYKAQCKVRKRVAKWLKPSEEVDIQLVKEDRGQIYLIQRYDEWLEMVSVLQAQK
jgi:Holliday junction resolvase|tara:strand:+ start:2839 stop:3150 length:312 start_codon:yes stop_codon:yes gene_type:complete